MSLTSHIAAQVAQAQTEAEKVFADNPVIDLDKRILRIDRDIDVNLSGPGNVVSTEVVNRRPVEGPKLDAKDKQSGGALHASDGPKSWGKVNRG